MKLVKHIFFIFIFSTAAFFSFAQEKPVITKVAKFKPPVVKTFLGVNQNGASVTADEAAQLITLPLKIVDDKNNDFKIETYQFLYRKKGVIQDEETGKIQPTFTIQAGRFDSTPLPKIWIDNLKDSFQKDEQIYYFDIIVKDKEGRGFFAPELKITIK